MKKYQGKGVYKSIAIGKVSVYKRNVINIECIKIDDVSAETARFETAKEMGVKDIYVHCFLDGRDVPPSSGITFVKQLEEKLKEFDTATGEENYKKQKSFFDKIKDFFD